MRNFRHIQEPFYTFRSVRQTGQTEQALSRLPADAPSFWSMVQENSGQVLLLRAMVLLGINCGFGNSDCGNMPLFAVDLDAGIIDYPRPKTGIQRRCALWPETLVALRDKLAKRPTPKSEEPVPTK